jgi:AraC family transcriptional regulator of adaptative response/methylated-DNA-[protein]-cysteine methyltransferase
MTWTDEQRWKAVANRDARADGEFVFAVKTTGVFCRPQCRSRAPLRKNVEFFGTPELAVRAGYRACKRCRPTDDARDELVRRACRLLEQEHPVEDLARELGLSPFHFQRWFKQRLGVTPGQWRRGVRAQAARVSLSKGTRVTDSVYDAGYSSSSRFYEGVAKELGMSPSAARQGAPEQSISWSLVTTSLGDVLLGWTERGVCHVTFEGTEAELRARFHQATLRRVARGPWNAKVRAIIEGTPAEVPVDLRGTAFQVRVWQALRDISAGQTRSYSQVANSLGRPGSARAIATACASNQVAVLVPCHRVVREGGALSGYRWGVERKAALLRREGALSE